MAESWKIQIIIQESGKNTYNLSKISSFSRKLGVFLADFLVLDKKSHKFCSFFTNFMAF